MSQVLVAGTAGGVGTTTVTALLFSAWAGRAGAPRLADHTAGTLGRRLAEGDEVGRLDDRTVLVDVGATAYAATAELSDPGVRLVLVTAATSLGCELAEECLQRVRGAGAGAAARTTLVAVGVHGRARIAARLRTLTAEHPGLRGSLVLDRDSALAAGGRIPRARLGRATQRMVEELAALTGDEGPVLGVRVSG